MTLLELIRKNEKELNNLYRDALANRKNVFKLKKFKELNNLLEELCYQYNCLLGAYWDKENWVYDYYVEILNNAPEHFKGNDLTDYVANELNKFNGVVVEKHYYDDTHNYTIYVVTRYSVYSYGLTRGYGKQCGWRTNGKTKTSKGIIEKNYWEILFSLFPSYEEDKEIKEQYNGDRYAYYQDTIGIRFIEKQLKKIGV